MLYLFISLALAAELNYEYQGIQLIINSEKSFNDALKTNASYCYNFFNSKIKNLTIESKLDIIDVCANPNSKKEGWND